MTPSSVTLCQKLCVTSHAFDPLSQTVTPSRTFFPLERDVLYGRPLVIFSCTTSTIKSIGLLELCADIVVSAAARRSISVGGGGAPPVQKSRRRRGAARRGRSKTAFSKVHEKISFYP